MEENIYIYTKKVQSQPRMKEHRLKFEKKNVSYISIVVPSSKWIFLINADILVSFLCRGRDV